MSSTASHLLTRNKLDELLRKRFFYAPAFSIYGGVAGLYDYGPPGCALMANILALWRSHFVLEEQMLEVDTTVMTPHDVLKTSGHVDRFTDYMVKDLKTGDFYRADHLLEAALEKRVADAACDAKQKHEYESILAQIDGYSEAELQALITRFGLKSDSGNDLSPVVKFNLMFGTDIGPTGYLKGFLRPETAQGQFTNFRRLLEYNNDRMPFASAQIGRSFRNEISPRSGLLRVREFTMAEVEHYVHPERKEHVRFAEVADVVLNFLPRETQLKGLSTPTTLTIAEAVAQRMVNNETLGYFLARTAMFLWRIGVKKDLLRFRQHMSNEMAHYASDCWDAEIHSSYGWIECVGCADRACFDLTMHTRATGERLVARERLSEPRVVNVRKLEINKKTIGIAFKKDAKAIVAHLESLGVEDITKLMEGVKIGKTESQAASGVLKVALPGDGQTFDLSVPDMVELVDTTETLHVLEYTPSVIEPSFGIGRIMYSLLEHVFWVREGDEQRCVLSIPAAVAPSKCLIAPLSPNEVFKPFLTQVQRALRRRDIACAVDESSTLIGKRYARNDEIGVPFGITVDFQTVQDNTVTVRERDSTMQVRVPIDAVAELLSELIEGGQPAWENVVKKYGLFTQQQVANGN